jgi:hypothetical protein
VHDFSLISRDVWELRAKKLFRAQTFRVLAMYLTSAFLRFFSVCCFVESISYAVSPHPRGSIPTLFVLDLSKSMMRLENWPHPMKFRHLLGKTRTFKGIALKFGLTLN